MPRPVASCLILALLGGCSFGAPPQSDQDRAASAACHTDADRAYAAQNRDQISEQNSNDTPFSTNGLIGVHPQDLSDRYRGDQLLDDCLRHSEGIAPSALR